MAPDKTSTKERSKQREFVWPPRAPEQNEAGTSGSIIESKPLVRRASTRQFPPERARRLHWMESLETALLGTRARVLTGRDGRWAPEATEAACPSCGRSVGMGEVSPADARCTQCRAEKLPWERFIRLGPFQGDLREAIHAMKYEAWRAQGTALGRLLGYRILDALRSEGIRPESALLVPVPMPTLRRLSRGIDHAMVLARAASSTSGVRCSPMLSKRGGRPQVEVAPSLRANNLRKKVRLRRVRHQTPQVVVLVDDVKTTGATLRACTRAAIGGFPGEKPRFWSAVVGVTSEWNRREGTENAPKA